MIIQVRGTSVARSGRSAAPFGFGSSRGAIAALAAKQYVVLLQGIALGQKAL